MSSLPLSAPASRTPSSLPNTSPKIPLMTGLPKEQLLELRRQVIDRQQLKAAQTNLIPFTERTFSQYATGRHHRIVAEHLERVERREIDRLMLLMPPRHGKSELASRRYPAWAIGRNPRKQIISASAGEDFASDIGREVRNIIKEPDYQEIFPGIELAQDSQAAGKWHTKQKGIFYAVGVGTQILGKGADEFVIDDPFGSMEDAQSPAERRRVIEWYKGSVYNRLQPGGAIIVINHRMHEDDLSGYLLEMSQNDGDKWEIVDLPAIAGNDDQMGRAPGEALWPEAYPIAALTRIKNNSSARYWHAMYQQNPIPDEGTFFKREWFQRYNLADRPKKLNIYGSSDFAVTEGAGDWTEHGVWGVDNDFNIYALAWWKGRTDAAEWIDAWLDLVDQWRPLNWFAEAGVIRRAIEPAFMKRQTERRIWTACEWYPSIKDKPTRARSFQSIAANRKVFFPKATWADDVIEQLVAFPLGKHDDSADVCGLLGRGIDKMNAAPKARDENVVKMDRYRQARQRFARSQESYRTV